MFIFHQICICLFFFNMRRYIFECISGVKLNCSIMSVLIWILAYLCSIEAIFVCKNGVTIGRSKLCNSIKDCSDGSDETADRCYNLICSKDQFRCRYGGCTDKAARCNGTKECFDGSDEKNCNIEGPLCGRSEFQCFYHGHCIDKKLACNGIDDCKDGSDEDAYFCGAGASPKSAYRCSQGGDILLELLCDGHPDCFDNSDESGVCKSKSGNVTCDPIKSNRLEMECVSDTLGYVSCDESVPVETVAKMDCKEYYLAVDGSQNGNYELRCQRDGNWNGNPLRCKPDCGTRESTANTLIIHGQNTTDWPWHGVMYMKQNGEWVSACGGTLISEDIVLTAAHCVWQKLPNHLKWAFSKYDADLDVVDDSTQIRDVLKIITRPEYLDYRSNYGSDIGVVILATPVEYSSDVRPICLDWEGTNIHHHLADGNLGTVVGMGIDESDEASKTLQILELPVVAKSICIKNHSRDFRKYVSYATFCAGWANGTSVCNGDSGGGLIFRDVNDPTRWILQGIVSVSPRRKSDSQCDPARYPIFTKVGLYLDWLKDVIGDRALVANSTKNV